jgi:hypothetical protein
VRFNSINICARLISLCILTIAPARAEAPHQLFNKTVQVNWTSLVNQTDPDGQTRNVSLAVSHKVYVSTAGRLFERASRATKRGMKQSENAPGVSRNAGGEATALRFDGNRLVGVTAFAQGARRFTVTFDPNFAKLLGVGHLWT